MAKIQDGLQQALVAERKKRQKAEKTLSLFHLGDKASKVAKGEIKSEDEVNPFGIRYDGEINSRVVLTPFTCQGQGLKEIVEGMPPYDLQATSTIEQLLKVFPENEVIAELSLYGLDGFLLNY
jgi:hypothetical protein